MSKIVNSIRTLALAAMATCAAAAARAAEAEAELTEEKSSPLSAEVNVDFFSGYYWRGCVVNDRPVLQPGVDVAFDLFGYGALDANIWQNYDLFGQKRVGHSAFAGLSEIDYTLSYSVDIKDFSLSVGHIWYTFPRANGDDYGPSTEEVFGTIAYNNEFITPAIGYYGDYNQVKGSYITLGLSREFALTDELTLGLEAVLGLCDKHEGNAYHGGDRNVSGGFSDVTADVYLSYAVTENISLGAKLAWSSLLGGAARDNAKDYDPMDERDCVWGGISAKFSF